MSQAGAENREPIKLIVRYSTKDGGEILLASDGSLLCQSLKVLDIILFLAGFQGSRPDTIFEFSTPDGITATYKGIAAAVRLSKP